jgi:hypothetical protein
MLKASPADFKAEDVTGPKEAPFFVPVKCVTSVTTEKDIDP